MRDTEGQLSSGDDDDDANGRLDDLAEEVEDLVADIRQHSVDRLVYIQLRNSDFCADYWDPLAERLVHYGCRVMLGWLCTGKITRKCQDQGHGAPQVPEWLMSATPEARDVRQELVGETVAHGLVIFRKKLIDDQWDPDAGRSLAAYFIGACLYAFPNVVRRWRNGEFRWRKAQSEWLQRGGAVVEPVIHPLGVVDAMLTLESLLKDEEQRVVSAVRLSYIGFNNVEIAHMLGLTDGAVRGIIRRWRQRVQLRLSKGEGASDEA